MADRPPEVQAFVDRWQQDPYMAIIGRMYQQAFAEGYDHARRRLLHRSMLIPAEYLAQLGPSDLHRAAALFLTDRQHDFERKHLDALATLAKVGDWNGGLAP